MLRAGGLIYNLSKYQLNSVLSFSGQSVKPPRSFFMKYSFRVWSFWPSHSVVGRLLPNYPTLLPNWQLPGSTEG